GAPAPPRPRPAPPGPIPEPARRPPPSPNWGANYLAHQRVRGRPARSAGPGERDRRRALKGQKTAVELRAESICAHSTVLRALGGLGGDQMKNPHWKKRMAGLEAIDWLKKNPDWQDVCIVANAVV